MANVVFLENNMVLCRSWERILKRRFGDICTCTQVRRVGKEIPFLNDFSTARIAVIAHPFGLDRDYSIVDIIRALQQSAPQAVIVRVTEMHKLIRPTLLYVGIQHVCGSEELPDTLGRILLGR